MGPSWYWLSIFTLMAAAGAWPVSERPWNQNGLNPHDELPTELADSVRKKKGRSTVDDYGDMTSLEVPKDDDSWETKPIIDVHESRLDKRSDIPIENKRQFKAFAAEFTEALTGVTPRNAERKEIEKYLNEEQIKQLQEATKAKNGQGADARAASATYNRLRYLGLNKFALSGEAPIEVIAYWSKGSRGAFAAMTEDERQNYQRHLERATQESQARNARGTGIEKYLTEEQLKQLQEARKAKNDHQDAKAAFELAKKQPGGPSEDVVKRLANAQAASATYKRLRDLAAREARIAELEARAQRDRSRRTTSSKAAGQEEKSRRYSSPLSKYVARRKTLKPLVESGRATPEQTHDYNEAVTKLDEWNETRRKKREYLESLGPKVKDPNGGATEQERRDWEQYVEEKKRQKESYDAWKARQNKQASDSNQDSGQQSSSTPSTDPPNEGRSLFSLNSPGFSGKHVPAWLVHRLNQWPHDGHDIRQLAQQRAKELGVTAQGNWRSMSMATKNPLRSIPKAIPRMATFRAGSPIAVF
ncbi:MAG: hypothetical protein M1823_004846 [Watsoniomyces obsoletus]|nr:MAG: hypothetical protein M1823_004846 [Watsoniomyces obsoletus]